MADDGTPNVSCRQKAKHAGLLQSTVNAQQWPAFHSTPFHQAHQGAEVTLVWVVGVGTNVPALDMQTPSHQTKTNKNKIKQTLRNHTQQQN